MTKPFHAGHAARSGVLAALLAREGWTASEQAIEGPQGYLHAFSAGRREPAALATLGAPWKITTTGVAVKPYPSCACTHSIIDGALELRRTHALQPSQIASVVIGVNRAVPNILIHSDPKNGLEAKFSGEFSAAAALIDGRVGIATFGDDKVRDPEVRALMGRVSMVVDPEIPGELERHMWTRVTIRLADGRTLSIGPRQVPGHPAHPLTPAALEEKFAECAGLVLPADRVGVLAEMLEAPRCLPRPQKPDGRSRPLTRSDRSRRRSHDWRLEVVVLYPDPGRRRSHHGPRRARQSSAASPCCSWAHSRATRASSARASDKGPSASLAPSTARSTYREYASPCGLSAAPPGVAGPFSSL